MTFMFETLYLCLLRCSIIRCLIVAELIPQVQGLLLFNSVLNLHMNVNIILFL